MSIIIAIRFDGNSQNIFYSGQLVTGHVHVQTSERIKIKGIRLELTGKAETSWTESERSHVGDDTMEVRPYRGLEDYMNVEIYLIGSRSNDSEMYLEPSVYKYPFSFILHPGLPQSFEDQIGHIRYIAKAVIDRPIRINDTAEVMFTVIRLLDLNREPQYLREPLVMHSEQPASGCCCVDGFVEINATINRGCFALGETIRVDGEITNRTSKDIKYSTVDLLQIIVYSATGYYGIVHRTKQAPTTLATLERPFLRRGHTDSLSNILFTVPQVFASRHDGCGIIDIKYYIKISAVFHTLFSISSATAEIVIGNVPLRNDSQPPAVTSQPLGLSVPYGMSDVHNLPLASAPAEEFEAAGVRGLEP